VVGKRKNAREMRKGSSRNEMGVVGMIKTQEKRNEKRK
jgi:hypothetical protein